MPWPERDFLLLAHLEKSHEGTWECTVTQKALNLTWTTAWIDLKVIAAPSYFSHLLEDDATGWLFQWTGSEMGVQILLGIIVVLSLGVCYVVYYKVVNVYAPSRNEI
ncbi:Aspartate--tRNA ligase [Frankliniella fusca]|uniref:Aspartate--tRNA ligase n=1 Tax=Frankliniella fusca TaxID=407009 RepID=A0AAE1HZC7_9NEOP|nr:Aspartate--tRNA ligase [Frankliniella fusca]